MKGNALATTKRNQPNAEKLMDGAIQRKSVQLPDDKLLYKLNKDKVGVSVVSH